MSSAYAAFVYPDISSGRAVRHEDEREYFACCQDFGGILRFSRLSFFFSPRFPTDQATVALFYPLSSGPRSVASSSRPQVSAPSSSSPSSRRTCLLLYLWKSRRSGMMGAGTISAAVVRSAPAGRRIDRAMTFWTATPRSVHHRRRYAA